MTRQPLREALKNLQAAREQLALAIRDVEAAIGAPLDRSWTFTLGELIGIHGEDPMFKTETTPDGTRVIRQVPGNHDHVGRGEMPEATKQLLQDLTGEVEDDGSGGEGQDRTAGGFVP